MNISKKLLSLSLLSIIFVPFFVSANNDTYEDAYAFAFENGITDKETMQQANMGGNLKRIEMAKMITRYATNVLGLTIPTNGDECTFSDVSEKKDKDYGMGVTNACKLGLMGQNMPDNKFRPEDTVTRAEFGTTLSRVIHKAIGSDISNGNPYYITHLAYLNEMGIMNDISNPSMLESRGNVMLMMMRGSNIQGAGDCVLECFDVPENGDFDAQKMADCLLSCVN